MALQTQLHYNWRPYSRLRPKGLALLSSHHWPHHVQLLQTAENLHGYFLKPLPKREVLEIDDCVKLCGLNWEFGPTA